VFENVKGLLTSPHEGTRIVTRILDDLAEPGKAVGGPHNRELTYHLHSLERQQASLPWAEDRKTDGEDYLLQAEHYGIPQMRHRIFIVGVRSDVARRPDVLQFRPQIPVSSVLSDLPSIRSALSRGKDSLAGWREAITAMEQYEWMSPSSKTVHGKLAREVRKVIRQLQRAHLEPGQPYMKFSRSPGSLGEWYRHNAVGLTLHESRSHMQDDLHRYLFSACFANLHGRSPKMRDFPEELYPSHQNVRQALKGNMFEDRFRVQLADRPSTTITSHVSKDGHYYIHYDPAQCRSLTVREAARLQTFPDNYFFEGTRTQQYGQVGNAVPPLLAREIAKVVFELLAAAGRGSTRASSTDARKKVRPYR
jgi:DNA (cytosine-5)-methyltransferase 1